MDDNNKAFPRGSLYFEKWRGAEKRERERERERIGYREKRRQGAVSLRIESSLQFMTRVGLRGTSRVKGG